MKKILIPLIACFVCMTGIQQESRAQAANTLKDMLSSPTHAVNDTVVNAGVKTQIVAVAGYQDIITIQTVVEKISGTVGGTIIIRGSIDGINYTTIGSDPYTATDVATQSKTWTVSPSAYTHYMVQYTGVTGPMSAKFRSKLLHRKRI